MTSSPVAARSSQSILVLRMLSSYVGEDLFLKGVSIYLKNHLYGNSVTNDLWAGIAKATGTSADLCITRIQPILLGVDIVKLMDNWISKV